jgi:hypothetical protein
MSIEIKLDYDREKADEKIAEINAIALKEMEEDRLTEDKPVVGELTLYFNDVQAAYLIFMSLVEDGRFKNASLAFFLYKTLDLSKEAIDMEFTEEWTNFVGVNLDNLTENVLNMPLYFIAISMARQSPQALMRAMASFKNIGDRQRSHTMKYTPSNN